MQKCKKPEVNLKKALLNIKDLIVYPGAELPVIEAIKLGAPGCISATANLNSKDIASVIDLCHSKEMVTVSLKDFKRK